MKILLAIALTFGCSSAMADQFVNGYYKNNGTYVQPYYRSSPNGYSGDNWSVKPNVNPYTGQMGTHSPTYGGYSSRSYGGTSNSYGGGVNLSPYQTDSGCTGLYC